MLFISKFLKGTIIYSENCIKLDHTYIDIKVHKIQGVNIYVNVCSLGGVAWFACGFVWRSHWKNGKELVDIYSSD